MLVMNSNPQGERLCGLAMPRIVLVDYNHAKIMPLPPDQLTWSPANPAGVFWNEYLWEDFGGWVPNEWQDEELQEKWLLRRFCGEGERHLYYPISEYLYEQLETTTTPPPRSSQPGQAQ